MNIQQAPSAGAPPDFTQLVAHGDACRNAQRWAEAAQSYATALRLRPSDAGIWVQLGHAHKENGAFRQAEAAYLKARALTPADSDLLLQLGHLHALRDNPAEAAAFYRQALRVGSQDEHARQYLARFGDADIVAMAPSTAALPAIYFEYTDLLSHFHANRNPTGIQRVQIELFRASLKGVAETPIHACAYVDRLGGWIAIDSANLLKLVDIASRPGSFDDPDWQQALRTFFGEFDSRPVCTFPIGAALVNIGTSWGLENYMSAIRVMKARYGLRYVPLVYDLIPLILPEFTAPGLPTVFNAWFSSALLHSDLFAAISRSTCDDVVRAAAAVRPLVTRPVVMALDAQSRAAEDTNSMTVAQALQRFGLNGRRFVLFVGTMEVRKNHYLVFQAWMRLLQQHGADVVPTLVCVGKRGWKFDQAQAFLDAHPEVEGDIVRLSDTSDAELSALYQACLFTVYASLYEGWGLPVTESLCHGKTCLTANHSSLPEAGDRFADYYEANSLTSFIEQAQRLILDSDYLQSREQLIATAFKPRRWEEVLTGLVDGIVAHFPQPATPAPVLAPIAFGTTYIFGKQAFDRRLDREAAIAEMLRHDGKGWYGSNDDCLWSRMANARLAFKLPAPPDADLMVFLQLRAPPEPVVMTIHLGSEGLGTVRLEAHESRVVRLDVPRSLVAVDIPAVLQLQASHLTVMQTHNPADKRRVGVGVEMFMCCLATDTRAHLGVIERTLMKLEDA